MTADGITVWSNRLVFYFLIDNVLSDIQEDTFRITSQLTDPTTDLNLQLHKLSSV